MLGLVKLFSLLTPRRVKPYGAGAPSASAGRARPVDCRVTLRDVTANQNLDLGIHSGRIRLKNLSADVNAYGIFATEKVTGRNVSASSNLNGSGVAGINVGVKLTNLTATDNLSFGVYGSRVRLNKSTVTGNRITGDPIAIVPIDIVSLSPPRVRNTVCGLSDDGAGMSWGICTND